jgi:hypothetical protein
VPHTEFVSLNTNTPTSNSSGQGTLPFTGLNLGLLALLGSLLIAAGVIQRRVLRAK